MKWYIILFGWIMIDYRIFLEYFEHMNDFILDGVVRLFLTYEMIQHISAIF
jgi:hypothetical protein